MNINIIYNIYRAAWASYQIIDRISINPSLLKLYYWIIKPHGDIYQKKKKKKKKKEKKNIKKL